jgi:hypothetical protein
MYARLSVFFFWFVSENPTSVVHIEQREFEAVPLTVSSVHCSSIKRHFEQWTKCGIHEAVSGKALLKQANKSKIHSKYDAVVDYQWANRVKSSRTY